MAKDVITDVKTTPIPSNGFPDEDAQTSRESVIENHVQANHSTSRNLVSEKQLRPSHKEVSSSRNQDDDGLRAYTRAASWYVLQGYGLYQLNDHVWLPGKPDFLSRISTFSWNKIRPSNRCHVQPCQELFRPTMNWFPQMCQWNMNQMEMPYGNSYPNASTSSYDNRPRTYHEHLPDEHQHSSTHNQTSSHKRRRRDEEEEQREKRNSPVPNEVSHSRTANPVYEAVCKERAAQNDAPSTETTPVSETDQVLGNIEHVSLSANTRTVDGCNDEQTSTSVIAQRSPPKAIDAKTIATFPSSGATPLTEHSDEDDSLFDLNKAVEKLNRDRLKEKKGKEESKELVRYLQTRCKQMYRDYFNSKDENEGLKKQVENLEKDNGKLREKKEKEELEELVRYLQTRCKQMYRDYFNSKDENEGLKKQVENLGKDNGKLREDLEKIKHHNEELEQCDKDLKQEIESMKQSNREMKQETEKMKQSNRELKQETERINQSNRDLKQEARRMKKVNDKSKQRNEEPRVTLQDCRSRLNVQETTVKIKKET
ncbi:uncharacterized protein FA14DRAFT_175302 [Meira miltonrushii]|uniref:Uncharacterized protein n=1 Tax=Meira miltonrushii TaxID=1280837 RepID=A0A316V2A2_9BASI|nr:uncharacterized protein FA14DRAFT_175302 [Meira miltonrushii]PWN31640.1 hypothetical protein FA14DRAFT_175302 [Meira miltonrushii]